MIAEQSLKLFESVNVRSQWNAEEEKWYFSVVDVVQVLTESERPRKYWSDLKAKLLREGSEVSEKIGHLKMRSVDGKERVTQIPPMSKPCFALSNLSHRQKPNLSSSG